MNPSSLVQRVWNYAGVLRDSGVSYTDYVEQITFLLFLKMDQELIEIRRPHRIPDKWNWQSLRSREGDDLAVHYTHLLEELGRVEEGKEATLVQTIFRKAQNKISQPALLKKLVTLIDEENWSGLDMDVKGDIYEGLLEKNAEDVRGGAGQYFTPRALISAMVRAIDPKPGHTIHDPACGTGGFLLVAYNILKEKARLASAEDRRKLQMKTFSGADNVANVVRLGAMNMYLHGIGGDRCPIAEADSLARDPGTRYDYVFTNPPFGKRSSVMVVSEEGKVGREAQTYERQDFWVTTTNKQLNFLQHVHTILKVGGEVAIVVPDNVLFEGGAGETVRRRLLRRCDVHTLLRLPTGIFYAQGVKANVLFFEKKPASETAWTKKLWVYDLRTNQDFTLKTNPLKDADLDDFIRCYNPANRFERAESERFRAFDYETLIQRDKTNLDLFWLKDASLEDSENLPAPEVLAREILADLESAVALFEEIAQRLGDVP